MIALGLMCASCAGSFEIPPRQPEVVAAPVVDDSPTLARTCFVRARLFRGLVPIKCADLALESRP